MGQQESKILGNQAEMRSRVYLLLSFFYSQVPKEEFIIKFKKEEFIDGLERTLPEGEGEIKKGLENFVMFLNSIKGRQEKGIVEDLAVDYTKLFRGLKKGYGPPPPYESVCRGEGRVMGELTQEVLKKYREARIGMNLSSELPDYIGIELKFMALLCYHEASAWRRNDLQAARKFREKEKKFLAEHLLTWVPQFCKMVEKKAESSFYRGVAQITRGFLERDGRQISKVLNCE